LMFVTIALGLAFPYVLLSWQPAWLKFLPKPGVWMQQFKVVMGFPMLATAVWLFWLTNKHYGRDGVLWIGIFLVVLALAAWVWGEFVQRGSRHRGTGMAASLLLLGAGYGYALEKELDWRSPRQTPDTAKGSSTELRPPLTADGKKVNWQPWSLAMIERARGAGRPVLVDFTAEWCLTCNANKKTSIEIPSTRQKLQALNVVPLTGDNTLQPPEILGELKKFGRAGVPLVLVYPTDKSRPPIVLPEVLTPGIVADALDQAAK
jgi:thiol:disulfide interchange protein